MPGWLATTDSLRLAARRWSPAKPGGTAVVLVHGFTATKDHPDVVATAEALCQAGYDVLSYDGRGHGDSEGVCTLGDHEELDVAAAAQVMAADSDRVVLVGASMGAIAVLRHAARAAADDGAGPVHGVVAVSSPARWRLPRTGRSALAALITQTPVGRRLAARKLGVRTADRWTRAAEPVSLVQGIAAPLAVIHGRDDRFLLAREAYDLYEAAAGPRRLDLVPGMAHAYGPAAIPAIAAAVGWILAVGTAVAAPDASLAAAASNVTL